MRLGAPRRLLTSLQERTGADAGSALDEAGEASRQAGQSSGQRGLSKRGSVLRLAAPFVEADRRENQSRRPSLAREKEKADQKREHNYDQVNGPTTPRCLKSGEGRTPQEASIR